MTPEKQLVQQIRDIIRAGQLEANPVLEDISEQFADLCHDVNARLQRCAEFLDRGMRSEAVHEANSTPTLFELIETVQFEEVNRWRNICVDLGLMMFPAIPVELVKRLQDECQTERGLQPLVKEYRRFVYQGDRDGCIAVLRQLRIQDPDNPSWVENLAPLEEEQMAELVDEAIDALDEDDRDRLRKIAEDWTDPNRVVPPPDEIMQEVRDALNAERRAAAESRAAKVTAALEGALDAEEFDRVSLQLADWDQLCQDDVFRPRDDDQALVTRAREWHEREAERRRQQAEFDESLRAFRDALRAGSLKPGEISGRWGELRAEGLPVPEPVEAEVEAALRRWAARRRRRARIIAAAIVLVLVAGAAAGGIYLKQVRTEARREAAETRMETLLRERKYAQLATYLDGLSRSDPEFHASPTGRHYKEQADVALSKQAEIESAFADIMDRLGGIRRTDFAADDETIQRLLAEARQIAYDDAANQQITAWEESWRTWQARKLSAATEDLQRVIAMVESILSEKSRKPFASPDAEDKALGRARDQWSKGAPFVPEAAAETVDAYNAAGVQLDGWRRDLEQRRTQLAESEARLEALRAEILRALPDLTAYRDLLQDFTEEFPDEPESPHYRRALQQVDAWNRAAALRTFRLAGLPPDAGTANAMRKLALSDSAILKSSPWESDVRRCLEYIAAIDRVRTKIPLLTFSKEEDLNLQVTYYRPRGETEWRPLYHPKPLVSRMETDEEGNEYRAYWGDIYWFERADQKPWLVHSSKIFPDKINTRDFEIRKEHRAVDNFVGHGRFLFRFVAQAAEARELDVHLLRGIQKLRDETSIELVPRAWLLKRLTHFLADNFPDTVPEAADMVRLADAMPTNVPWINRQHADVLAAEEAIAAQLKSFPDTDPIVERLRLRRGLLVLTLNRRVRPAGMFRYGPDGTPTVHLAGDLPEEAWLLTAPAPGARPSFRLGGRKGPGGDVILDPDVARSVFVGQVFFTPSDGRETQQLLREFLGQADKDLLRRPDSWPENAW